MAEPPVLMRQEIEVEIEEIPQQVGTPAGIVRDTLETASTCLDNFHAALDNFRDRLTAESGDEAAPKDPAMLALQAVGSHLLSAVRAPVAAAVPGGQVFNSLVSLGQSINTAVTNEQERSQAASERNAAAEFIIDIRTTVAQAKANIRTNMHEDVEAARARVEAAGSDEERHRLRRLFEDQNHRMDELSNGPFSVDALFVRLTEAWINENAGEGDRPVRVVIDVDHEWQVSKAYLDAPYGSRLAAQLERRGGLPLSNFSVPRLLRWFPIEGNKLPMITCNLAPDNSSSNPTVRSTVAGQYLPQFIRHLRDDPIPQATVVRGRQV